MARGGGRSGRRDVSVPRPSSSRRSRPEPQRPEPRRQGGRLDRQSARGGHAPWQGSQRRPETSRGSGRYSGRPADDYEDGPWSGDDREPWSGDDMEPWSGDDREPVPGRQRGRRGKRRRRRRDGDSGAFEDDAYEDFNGPDDDHLDDCDVDIDDGEDYSRDPQSRRARRRREGKGGQKGNAPKRHRGSHDGDFDEVFDVLLHGVPENYTHEVILELHDSLGLNARGLRSSRLTSGGVASGPAPSNARTMVLTYDSERSAREAAAKLHGQPVAADEAAEVWNLNSVLGPRRRMGDEILEIGEMYDGKVKEWAPDRGFGFVAADNCGPSVKDLFIHCRDLVDGKALVVGSSVRFEVAWDEAKAKYHAVKCTGAVPAPADGHLPPARPAVVPADPSQDLLDFGEIWAVERSTLRWVAGHPASLQDVLIETFNPDAVAEDNGDINEKIRLFVNEWMAKNDSGSGGGSTIVGEMLSGKVEVWHDDRGFGFVALDDGGQRIFVHANVVYYGEDRRNMAKGVPVIVEVDWDERKQNYKASSCAIATKADLPDDMSDDLTQFGEAWSLNQTTIAWLSRFHVDVLATLIRRFTPDLAVDVDESADINKKVISYTTSLRKKVEALPSGERIRGHVSAWNADEGVGTVVPYYGDPPAHLDKNALVDGDLIGQGMSVEFEARWDTDHERHVVDKCYGALDTTQFPEGADKKMLDFATGWALDQATISWFLDFSTEVQSRVASLFEPKLPPGHAGVGPKFRKFVQSIHESEKRKVKWQDEHEWKETEPIQAEPEVSSQITYFAQLWEIDYGTVSYLARLPSDIQEAVTEFFEGGSSSSSSQKNTYQASFYAFEPSENLFLGGLPAMATLEQVKSILRPFGPCTSIKMLPVSSWGQRSALVSFATAEHARLAVEDLNGADPTLSGSKLSVKYADKKEDKEKETDEPKRTELPIGEVLYGKIKTWKEDRGFGFINVDGGGPEVFVYSQSLQKVMRPVEPGLLVSFEVKFNEEKKQYFTEKCWSRDKDRASKGPDKASEVAFLGKTVRAFARAVQARVQAGAESAAEAASEIASGKVSVEQPLGLKKLSSVNTVLRPTIQLSATGQRTVANGVVPKLAVARPGIVPKVTPIKIRSRIGADSTSTSGGPSLVVKSRIGADSTSISGGPTLAVKSRIGADSTSGGPTLAVSPVIKSPSLKLPVDQSRQQAGVPRIEPRIAPKQPATPPPASALMGEGQDLVE